MLLTEILLHPSFVREKINLREFKEHIDSMKPLITISSIKTKAISYVKKPDSLLQANISQTIEPKNKTKGLQDITAVFETNNKNIAVTLRIAERKITSPNILRDEKVIIPLADKAIGTCLTVNPTTNQILVGCTNGTVHVYDVNEKCWHKIFKAHEVHTGLQMYRDDKAFITRSGNELIFGIRK